MERRLTIDEGSRPNFPRHVKLHFNKQRGEWVILAPERVLVPDETALEVLRLCDGKATVATIIDELKRKYDAPREVIGKDVTDLLQGLADKGFIAA